MSRHVGCPCGAEQSDTVFPAHNKAHLITDADLDAITLYGLDEAVQEDDVPMSSNGFEMRAKVCWFCWRCGRFLIYDADGTLAVYEKRKETT